MSGQGNYTLTPNYGLLKPVSDSDDDLWGTHLNQSLDILDSVIKTVDSKGPYLPLSGGTMLGAMSLAGNAASAMQPVTLQQMQAAIGAGGNFVSKTGDVMSGSLGVGITPPPQAGPDVVMANAFSTPVTGQGGGLGGNAYRDASGAWRYLRAGTASLWLNGGADTTQALSAPSGAQDALITWRGQITLGPQGNVRIGQAGLSVPSDVAAGSTLFVGQSATLATDVVNPTDAQVAGNAYPTASAWKYIGTGQAALATVWASAQAFAWYTAPSGSAGGTIAWTRQMVLGNGQITLGGATNPGVALNALASGQPRSIWGYTAGSLRWQLQPGNGTAEASGNVGSDFGLYRYDNSGAYIDAAMMIYRSSGLTQFSGSVQSISGTISTNNNSGGSINLQQGGANNAGYVAFFAPNNGARRGYVGFSNASTMLIDGDGLAINVMGRTTFSSDVTVSGRLRYTGDSMNVSGVFRTRDNENNYLQHVNNGDWQFVNNGAWRGSFYANGDFGVAAAGWFPNGVFADNSGSFRIYNDNSWARHITFGSSWEWTWNTSNGDLNWWEYNGNNALLLRVSDRSTITWNGPNYATAFNLLSDERLKDDIEPDPTGLDAVMALRPIRYTHVNFSGERSKHVQIGFSAQQLQTVLPDAVMEAGAPPGHEPVLGYSLTAVVAVMVNAIQSINARLEALEGHA